MLSRQMLKYEISATAHGWIGTFEIPHGSFVRHVGQQEDLSVCIWVECVWRGELDECEKVSRSFAVVGTGQDVPDRAEYQGTCLGRDPWGKPSMAWHVFELHDA